jgi:two-component system, OmpR family, phosphate regulon sensor histidine kinase PhoR
LDSYDANWISEVIRNRWGYVVVHFAESEPASRSEQNLPSAGEFNEVLLAMAAHDLRQPLQVILSAFAWLERHHPGERERRYVEVGQLAARRLREQLDHLANAVRLNHRRRGALLSPVKLAPLLDALQQENADLVRERGLTIRICPTRTVIMSDATLLHSMLYNLIRNAIKYTPKGGRILVGCRGSGPNVRIEVHDTGIGIRSDHLPKVFDAFYRLDSTEPDGLGLGLFVVRRAADLLGHRVGVRSAVGHGSCFSILAGTGRAANRSNQTIQRSIDDRPASLQPCAKA